MAGIRGPITSNQEALVVQELLSLKVRLAAQLSAGTEASCSCDFSTLFSCALHQNDLVQDTRLLTHSGHKGVCVPKPPSNNARCGQTQISFSCEVGHASQSASNFDDVQTLQKLKIKLATRLAETARPQQSCKCHDHERFSVIHLKL